MRRRRENKQLRSTEILLIDMNIYLCPSSNSSTIILVLLLTYSTKIVTKGTVKHYSSRGESNGVAGGDKEGQIPKEESDGTVPTDKTDCTRTLRFDSQSTVWCCLLSSSDERDAAAPNEQDHTMYVLYSHAIKRSKSQLYRLPEIVLPPD